MPSYTFFETIKPSNSSKKEPSFNEFNLKTLKRSSSRLSERIEKIANEPVEQEYVFKANKMPDFSEKFHGFRPKSPKKLTSFTPFNLSTIGRGTDK